MSKMVKQFENEYEVKYLGEVNYLLGIEQMVFICRSMEQNSRN